MASTNSFGKKFDNEPEKPERELSFKEKLDKAAIEAREPPEDKQDTDSYMKPIIEKVTEYIPAAAGVLGDSAQQGEQDQKEKATPDGPPERPIHDHQIEEFVRDQHRSKGEDGKLV